MSETTDKRDECGCHRECTTLPHECAKPDAAQAREAEVRARVEQLETTGRALLALCDERDQLTYGDTPHPGYLDTDEVRAVLDGNATPADREDPTDA